MTEDTTLAEASAESAEPRAPEAVAPEAEALADGVAALTESTLPPEEISRITDDIVAALKTVYDPEIPVDIFELGLIYKVDIEDDRSVSIDMTLTAPSCPVAGDMLGWVQDAVSAVPGVGPVDINMVFDPPWDPSRMSDEARVALNFF
ncbi:SUF system Fe-S cluster assembly protein [Breoghania sp.]|uniref:SUF system Fe-S cluster assembly protein n=1 Tax=Breoghania sp. TaxID=2065378 RepID=UPI00263263FE|nr:SUF system Fe-S cluster assembly protein [Breoghania sp.]MDJ0932902.1 SUF system Fe-S cluster assembly protein [Breoghania sp.]